MFSMTSLHGYLPDSRSTQDSPSLHPDPVDGSGLAEVEATLLANPNKPEVLDWAAFAYYTAGNLPRALACYQRALLLEDDNPHAYFYLGTIYCRLGRFDQAARYWHSLLTRYPDHALARKKLSEIAGGDTQKKAKFSLFGKKK